MGNQINPEVAVEKANALADAAKTQARTVREAAGELLKASGEAAVRPSDVIGGLIGGASAGASAIYFIGLTSLSAIAIPFIAVAGLGMGIMVIRGPRAIVADRERRAKSVAAASLVDKPRMLREEIEAAKAGGAPDRIIDQLWQRYADELAPLADNVQVPAPKSILALPPGES